MKITFLQLIYPEKNEVEEVKFKKSKGYAVTGLSIHQDVESDLVAVTDTEKKKKQKVN